MDDEETMTECSAAMLLMKLSCSPHSNPALLSSAMLLSQSGTAGHSGSFAGSLPSYPNMPSPVDSSGKEYFHTFWQKLLTPLVPIFLKIYQIEKNGEVLDLFEIF